MYASKWENRLVDPLHSFVNSEEKYIHLLFYWRESRRNAVWLLHVRTVEWYKKQRNYLRWFCFLERDWYMHISSCWCSSLRPGVPKNPIAFDTIEFIFNRSYGCKIKPHIKKRMNTENKGFLLIKALLYCSPCKKSNSTISNVLLEIYKCVHVKPMYICILFSPSGYMHI